MSLKNYLKTYFSFSSSERKSLIILLTILLGVFAYPLFVSKDRVPLWEQNTEKQKTLDSLLDALTIKSKNKGIISHKLFSFDPNQIDSAVLLSLGFSDYMAKNLLAYRKSGGNIAHKADLRKIYGMTDDLYNRLEPFVEIDSKKVSGEPESNVDLKPFDLNRVDSMELLSLGFSEFQTRNFLRYRKQFGQFRTKEELKKVYGVDSADFKKYENFIQLELNNLNTKTYLFPFDPNLISRSAWDSLGVKSNLVDRITKFLSKGGKFHKAQDLKRIYGFDSLKYVDLEPYINIPKKTIIKKGLVDLNNGDSIDLQSLPGIGPYFSKQIINYRKKLGGFYSIDQLQDIHGLRMSRVDSIRIYLFLDVINLHFININKASIEELNDHPYISYKEASDIVRLRKRKGPIVSLEILKKRRVFSKSTFKRVKPYLILE
ncbi:MAG: DNA uptake protein ComE-like DNA-binding protein [Ancylomarina sp.]|jgi:DNA uptake protein ComE-like DNA-binding protein